MSPVTDRAHHRMRRRAPRAIVAALALGLVAPLVIASPASADKISDMRKQAQRMADQLDNLEAGRHAE